MPLLVASKKRKFDGNLDGHDQNKNRNQNQPAAKKLKTDLKRDTEPAPEPAPAIHFVAPELDECGNLNVNIDMLKYFMQASILVLPTNLVQIAYEYAAHYYNPENPAVATFVMESSDYQVSDADEEDNRFYSVPKQNDVYLDGYKLEPEHFIKSNNECCFPIHIPFWKRDIQRAQAAVYECWIGHVRSIVYVHEVNGSQVPALSFGAFAHEWHLFCNQFGHLLKQYDVNVDDLRDAALDMCRGDHAVSIPFYSNQPTSDCIWRLHDYFTGESMQFATEDVDVDADKVS